MTQTDHDSVIQCEKRLIAAQKNSDVDELDQLLHDGLLFIIPNGQVITKQIDLESHRNHVMVVESNTPSEQTIKLIEDIAVVTTIVELKGRFNNQPIDAKFRYIRVWKRFNSQWKMFAGSAVQIL